MPRAKRSTARYEGSFSAVPTRKRILVLGCGNPARGDDGLGPALIERLERASLPQVETRVGYQLCVEDALDIGCFRQVIFVDASYSADPPFEYYPLQEDATRAELDTHGVSPEALMILARTLFGAETPAHVLAIRGYAFEPFVETLSSRAKKNLDLAFRHLSEQLSIGTETTREKFYRDPDTDPELAEKCCVSGT